MSTSEAVRIRLVLYVGGDTTRSRVAEHNVRAALERQGVTDAQFERLDVHAAPERAARDRILLTPTLRLTVRGVSRNLIGNLDNADQLDAFLFHAGVDA
jgi:hypothetical protein